MQRRSIIYAGCGLLCACIVTGVQAHTLYNQWVVFRKKHLVIGSHREDLVTYQLARKIVAILNEKLPKASARVARAPTSGRIASLIGTAQMDVAMLSHQEAVDMAAGKGTFKPYGEIDIKALFLAQHYVLVGRADIPDKHSWLIAHALDGSELITSDSVEPPVPWHHGTRLYHSGKPLTDT